MLDHNNMLYVKWIVKASCRLPLHFLSCNSIFKLFCPAFKVLHPSKRFSRLINLLTVPIYNSLEPVFFCFTSIISVCLKIQLVPEITHLVKLFLISFMSSPSFTVKFFPKFPNCLNSQWMRYEHKTIRINSIQATNNSLSLFKTLFEL